MRRSRIAALALLLACCMVDAAEQIVAINDYLKPIVSKIAADPNTGGWTWETNSNGGYLLRMEMDVTGDGRPELFVTTSLTATMRIAEWAVFDMKDTGEIRPYGRSLRLPADSVWPTGEQNSPALIYLAAPDRERERASEEKVYPVYRFSFAFPIIKEALSYVSEEDVAKVRPADPTQLPKLQAIMLADYLLRPDVKWSEVTEWKLDSNACFFRVEDKERAAKNTTFTPQLALSHLGVVQSAFPSGEEQSSPYQPKETILFPATPKPSVTKEMPSTPNSEPVSSTPWSMMLVCIVAMLGLLWLFFKRRS